MGLGAGLDGTVNLTSTGCRTPDHPARCKSLYQLRCGRLFLHYNAYCFYTLALCCTLYWWWLLDLSGNTVHAKSLVQEYLTFEYSARNRTLRLSHRPIPYILILNALWTNKPSRSVVCTRSVLPVNVTHFFCIMSNT